MQPSSKCPPPSHPLALEFAFLRLGEGACTSPFPPRFARGLYIYLRDFFLCSAHPSVKRVSLSDSAPPERRNSQERGLDLTNNRACESDDSRFIAGKECGIGFVRNRLRFDCFQFHFFFFFSFSIRSVHSVSDWSPIFPGSSCRQLKAIGSQLLH